MLKKENFGYMFDYLIFDDLNDFEDDEDAKSAKGYVLQLFCRAFDENRDQTSDGTNEMKTQCVCEMLNFKTYFR